MTQKTGRFGASGREFCLYSLEKEDIEETLQLMDRCVGENLYQKEEDTRLTEQKIQQVCQQDTLAPVGKIQSVGIKETFRRQGLAVWLMKYALRQFAEKGIGEVFIICWNAGGKVPLEKALQECRFVHLFSAKMIWYNKKELYCPYCKGRCKCDAEVYFKKVKERNCK